LLGKGFIFSGDNIGEYLQPIGQFFKTTQTKLKNILAGIGFLIFFFIVVNLIPPSGKPYYEYENYKKTIDSPIIGSVKRLVVGKNFFGAQFGADPSDYYGFTYQVERTPKDWLNNYPTDFILVQDSIIKKANNDTFTVIRQSHHWTYVLPKDSISRK